MQKLELNSNTKITKDRKNSMQNIFYVRTNTKILLEL